MIKIPSFYANVDIDWCRIWDEIDETMISEVLYRISEDYADKFRDWLKDNGEELLKKDLETFTDITKIRNINPIDYRTLERF